MQTEALMSKSVAACNPADSLATAAQIMWDRDVGFLPVVEPDGNVVGTLTDRDIAMAGFMNDQPLAQIPVWRVMSTKVITCRTRTDVEEAEKLMRSAQVRRLPVLGEHDRLAGVLSLTDFARASAGRREGMRGIDLAGTLAQIATSHSEAAGQTERRSPELRA